MVSYSSETISEVEAVEMKLTTPRILKSRLLGRSGSEKFREMTKK